MSKNLAKKNNNTFTVTQGFTLIEIIVVVVILALVAVAIVPRLVDMSESAELQKVQATAGAFKSAVNLVKLTFDAQGRTVRVQNLPNFGQGNVDTNNLGYPIGIDKGNINESIGQGPEGCNGVWTGILNVSSTVSTNATADYQSFRHNGNQVCSYVYRQGGDTAPRTTAMLVIQYDSRDGRVYTCGLQAGVNACIF